MYHLAITAFWIVGYLACALNAYRVIAWFLVKDTARGIAKAAERAREEVMR